MSALSREKVEFQTLCRAGTIGAVALCVLCTPLDVARLSAQAAISKKSPAPGIRAALRAAAAKPRGLAGLWRGLPWSLGRAGLSPASFLLFYELQKGGSTDALEAGLAARALQTGLVQPLDHLRTCRQGGALLGEQGAHLGRSVWDILTSDGPKSCWRGLVPTLLRDVSASGAFWASYVGLQYLLDEVVAPAHGEDGGGGGPRGGPVRLAGIGAVCAVAATAVTQPFDVVKTKMQVHEQAFSGKGGYRIVKIRRVWKTFREVYSAGGIRCFWTGWLPRASCALVGGFLLGPLYEFGQLIMDDAARPLRVPLDLPDDPAHTIVHPRSSRSMYIEVK